MCLLKRKMRYVMSMGIVSIILFKLLPASAHANIAEEAEKEAPKVLVVFSSQDNDTDEHQRKLDMLLGRFTDNIAFKASTFVEEHDFEEVTHLFYYGQQKAVLPQDFLQMLEQYRGTMVAIGYNAEQIRERFSFINILPAQAVIDHISQTGNSNKSLSFLPILILNTYLVDTQSSRVLLTGKRGENEYPVFVSHYDNYYFASSSIEPPFSIALAEMLHEVFEGNTHITNPGYIRLEDIHPLTDPENMMEIAAILKGKNIPYMIAVIPVYTNRDTGIQYHFSDSPKLLKALKYMQNNGGSIVLHGYTHQFRASETGEGFEFWDVENNMPIYHNRDADIVIKTRRDFENDEEYEDYLVGQKAFERDYIETRLTKGIQELANYGLYPLAFEAPHYAMSQHGYQVSSEYFSTYVGHLQLSDADWEITATAPYITKPTFLHGMTLLPETIGYVDPDDPYAVEKMIKLAGDYQFVRDGMVAGFYHPYLGVELFEKLIEEMEKIPHVSWIDLKEMSNRVNAKHVEIRTDDGQLMVKLNHGGLFLTSRDYLTYHINVLIKRVTWCMAGIGSLAASTFVYNILISIARSKRKKRGRVNG